MRNRPLALFLVIGLSLLPCDFSTGQQRSKLRGYVTSVPDEQTLLILDDVVHFSAATRFETKNESGAAGHLGARDVAIGVLIEAEGMWTAKHQFSADKITCDAEQFEKTIRESVYLQEEPSFLDPAGPDARMRMRADGEILVLNAKAQRSFEAGTQPAAAIPSGEPRFTGRKVRYAGPRTSDGFIDVREVEFGPPPPADAFAMPGNLRVVRATDPQTNIEILEFRKGSKVEGRLKLFPVREVQEYVKALGMRLLPPGGMRKPFPPLEFQFFVVEDGDVNASALPDGTVLVHTGLLGLVENEAQLAFVLSHEISHVLQAHYWREVHETRTKRVLLTVAALAGSYYIGNLAVFLGQIGIASVVNGYSRRIENQADRIGLQNVIDLGYDPLQAIRFFRIITDRYGQRSTSALWSNHDSSILRGSFLTVQMSRRYPGNKFESNKADSAEFRAMRAAMGPVKIK